MQERHVVSFFFFYIFLAKSLSQVYVSNTSSNMRLQAEKRLVQPIMSNSYNFYNCIFNFNT